MDGDLMTQLATRALYDGPWKYKGFELVSTHGRFFAIPDFLDAEEIHARGLLRSHPAVLSGATKEEMEARIDEFDAGPYLPEIEGHYQGYDLVRYRGACHGVPRGAGFVDLNLEEDCRHAGVISGRTRQEVEERIRGLGEAVPVEFAGWLPVFERAGNCGKHPQFTHTTAPPPGYRFTYSAPPKKYRRSPWQKGVLWLRKRCGQALRAVGLTLRPLLGIFRGKSGGSPLARLRVLAAVMRLFVKLLWGGARLLPVLRFLRTRHYQSQVLLGNYRGLVFLTSMPYTYGQNPWVIEIEDPTTLFHPLIHNGHTFDLNLAKSPYFPIVKSLLESDQCRGILTHMKSTAAMVPTLFGSEKIRAKVHYAPLGVKLAENWQRHDESEHIHLLFINSWCQVPHNFCLRGGLDVLEAFSVLHRRYPNLRLTLRTNLPGLDEHYYRIMEQGWVRLIDRFLTAEEMDALLAESHIFLLPAARVHIVSLLQAMSYGLAVVASDGWGFEEYLTHERNGLIVQGRYGKVSWADHEVGMLKEDYAPMSTSDPDVVRGIVEAVSRLVEDRELRRRLGRAARRDVETKYTLERWNLGLKEVLDSALEPHSPRSQALPGNALPRGSASQQ
jgi:glycosyltransferase involved in cell wall biosynthesis